MSSSQRCKHTWLLDQEVVSASVEAATACVSPAAFTNFTVPQQPKLWENRAWEPLTYTFYGKCFARNNLFGFVLFLPPCLFLFIAQVICNLPEVC